MNKFYDDQEECSTAERQERINLRISAMVQQGYKKSSRIRKIFDEYGLNFSTIKTIDDFERLPVISRAKLIELESIEPPFGGFENPDENIDRIFTSPGPVYEPHLSENNFLWARAYFAAGIKKGDVVLNAFSYHMVAAGLTFHGGLRRLGATVVPSGTSGSQIQVQLIKDLGVTVYTGTPSFLMSIIRKSEEMGYNFRKDFNLKCACFAAEPLEASLREVFEKEYAIDTYQMYGATEVGDIAFECGEKKGWHICEEVYVEIVDPLTGTRVPPGTYGEVVVTRLNDIFFLFRFGTGDLSRLLLTECPCGRRSYRLDGLAGRIGDAVKVRGLFITPNQMKKVQEKFPEFKFQVMISRTLHEDMLTLKVETNIIPPDSSLEMKISHHFKEVLTVKVDRLIFVETGTLRDGDKLIVDQRKWL